MRAAHPRIRDHELADAFFNLGAHIGGHEFRADESLHVRQGLLPGGWQPKGLVIQCDSAPRVPPINIRLPGMSKIHAARVSPL
jgi:hypothetical protein